MGRSKRVPESDRIKVVLTWEEGRALDETVREHIGTIQENNKTAQMTTSSRHLNHLFSIRKKIMYTAKANFPFSCTFTRKQLGNGLAIMAISGHRELADGIRKRVGVEI